MDYAEELNEDDYDYMDKLLAYTEILVYTVTGDTDT